LDLNMYYSHSLKILEQEFYSKDQHSLQYAMENKLLSLEHNT
jgi:hypothetical protein